MYYKIENKECEVYKKLHELRTKELQMEKDNIKAIEEKTGMTFEKFFGCRGQQTFSRVTSYSGFAFKQTEKIDPKIWKPMKDDPEVYVPNRRTNAGREMSQFLSNGLQSSYYGKVLKILSLEELGKFVFPYVEIFDDVVFLYLGDKHEPKDENVIEITKKEFLEKLKIQEA